jgi:preprotein translocase subunit YajC
MNWLGLLYATLCIWIPFGLIFVIAYFIGKRMQKKIDEKISNDIKQWEKEDGKN